MKTCACILLLILSSEAIRINENLRRKVHKEYSVASDGEMINVYQYTDENGETIYENEEQHEASCKRRIPVLCDHKHHGKLSAKLVGLYTRYYEQVKIKNEHIITYSLTELLAGKDIDDMLTHLNNAKTDLISLGNKCGGMNYFVGDGNHPVKQRCNFCGERGGCDGLRMTEEWFNAALKKVIDATREMRTYVTGFENAADVWIKTLEETRDTSFEVCRACAVAIAVPYAAGMVTTAGAKLLIGTSVGAMTSGTVTAGTEALKQGLDMAHGLQGDFDWSAYADAIGESMKKGAIGGAAGVIMNLGAGALQQLINKIGGKVAAKLIESGVSTTEKAVTEYLTRTCKAIIRQLVISSYNMMNDPKYTGKDMFDDMALALLVGGVAQNFGMDPGKVNGIAVTDKLVRVVKEKLE